MCSFLRFTCYPPRDPTRFNFMCVHIMLPRSSCPVIFIYFSHSHALTLLAARSLRLYFYYLHFDNMVKSNFQQKTG